MQDSRCGLHAVKKRPMTSTPLLCPRHLPSYDPASSQHANVSAERKAKKDARPKKIRPSIGQDRARGGLFLQERVSHWSSLWTEGWDWRRLSKSVLRAEAGRVRREWPVLGSAPSARTPALGPRSPSGTPASGWSHGVAVTRLWRPKHSMRGS